MPNDGDLRVWWIPQVPGDPFYVDVSSVEEGVFLMRVLADYDAFQYNNNIKPDYSNVGGMDKFYAEESTWYSWDMEVGNNYFDDPQEYLASLGKYDLDKGKLLR